MKNLSILVAEDDADDRFLIKKAMEESGAGETIDFVENGVELMDHLNNIKTEKIATNYPKFILLDLNMPKMDGREALETIKLNKDFKKIPVIVFSTTKNQIEVKRCYDLGANTYIVKPVNFDSLVAIIQDLREYWFNTATLADNA